MEWILKLFGYLSVAPLKDYRTQVLGIVLALTGLINAAAAWSVGDLGFSEAIKAIADNWETLAAGFALWFGGDKLNTVAGKPTTASAFMGWPATPPAAPAKKK